MRRALSALFIAALLLVSAPWTAAQPADAISVAAQSRSLQPGELIVLTLTTTAAVDSIDVRVFDRVVPAFRVDARTWRALVGIDLAVVPRAYVATVEGRSGGTRLQGSYAFAVKSKQFQTRRLTVDPDFVTPPTAEEDRIIKEAAELDRLVTAVSPERFWDGKFVAPVRAPANSAFGSRSVFNGVERNPHGGADFSSATGTPIAAPNAGRVVLARNLYFTGNTVVLDHGLGLVSLLAHMSAMDVKEGDLVTSGQILGKVGATGRVTGPHLHWGVRLGGARVDPVALLALLGPPPTAKKP